MQWFVVHTKPRQEQRALVNLQRQGFAAWLPMLSVEKFRRGRLEKVVVPMFSRYLFIRLDTEQTNWSPIRSTLGVSKLVSFGNRPAVIEDELILALQQLPVVFALDRAGLVGADGATHAGSFAATFHFGDIGGHEGFLSCGSLGALRCLSACGASTSYSPIPTRTSLATSDCHLSTHSRRLEAGAA